MTRILALFAFFAFFAILSSMFEAIEFGPFILWTHLLFLLLGVWLSTEFFLRLALSAGLSVQHVRDHSWHYAAAFALGGRIAAILGEYRVYVRDPVRMLVFWDGNFSFVGAAAGVGAVLFLATRDSRTTFLQWLDVLLPATMLGLSFDWIGKFAAGQAYGAPTDAFWGVTYDVPHVRYAVPVHPVQLYYAIFYFALTFLLLVVRKHARRAGAETLAGIVTAAVVTMVFEYFRGDFVGMVFATQLDFLVLVLLFVSLGVLAVIELKISQRAMRLYVGALSALLMIYLVARQWVSLPTMELRSTQFAALLALLATVVYVVVHRRRYPHL